jgi:hypothetical protein
MHGPHKNTASKYLPVVSCSFIAAEMCLSNRYEAVVVLISHYVTIYVVKFDARKLFILSHKRLTVTTVNLQTKPISVRYTIVNF